MTIRSADENDAAAIAAIYAHHVQNGTATFDTMAPTVEQTRDKITAHAARGWPFLVAQDGGVVAGYAYAAAFRDRPAYALTCEDSIYLHPGHLGRGLGKALLGALLADAEAAGFRQMIAVVGGGEAASVAVHASLGFRHCGGLQSVGRKFGRWLDTVYMQVALGMGDRRAPLDEP